MIFIITELRTEQKKIRKDKKKKMVTVEVSK